ncbi:MAG: hypothetical protein OEW97_02605 [Gammaproteobacteria bacterium]|nr:hypothetical protein [Gammaproteobacteria bacterium]
MITLTGEVRKVEKADYTNKKTGEITPQSILIMEPLRGRSNYEIYLNEKQISGGAVAHWEKLKGKQASIPVHLFVNYDYKFHKFNAYGDGLPLNNKQGV